MKARRWMLRNRRGPAEVFGVVPVSMGEPVRVAALDDVLGWLRGPCADHGLNPSGCADLIAKEFGKVPYG